MPVNMSLRNVPDKIVDKLRSRARRNHRSLQGELMAILEEAVEKDELTLERAEAYLKDLGFATDDESAAWVREERDAR